MNFLDQMESLTDQERNMLRSLGVDSAIALYFLLRASRHDFERRFGAHWADRTLKELQDMIPKAEIEAVSNAQFEPPPLGVPVETEPAQLKTGINIDLRDELFQQLQMLRRIKTAESEKRAREVEQKLNNLLAGAAVKSRGAAG
jgi:hypothetical protein